MKIPIPRIENEQTVPVPILSLQDLLITRFSQTLQRNAAGYIECLEENVAQILLGWRLKILEESRKGKNKKSKVSFSTQSTLGLSSKRIYGKYHTTSSEGKEQVL